MPTNPASDADRDGVCEPLGILIAIRDLVWAGEEAGFDLDDNKQVLDRGRAAYAALKEFLSGDDDVGRAFAEGIL